MTTDTLARWAVNETIHHLAEASFEARNFARFVARAELVRAVRDGVAPNPAAMLEAECDGRDLWATRADLLESIGDATGDSGRMTA